MKNTFNVGDKVKIRADLKAESNVGGFRVAPEMAELAGVDAVITGKRSNGTYGIDVRWGSFTWSEEMFEPVEPAAERKTFETGAVRDTDKTKGRCDLMPLQLLFDMLDTDTNVACPWQSFEIVRDSLKNNKLILAEDELKYLFRHVRGDMDDNPIETALDLSVHFKTGAEKYGVDNWKKGIPMSSYLNSAIRHYMKHIDGRSDENHKIACLWNILCLCWTIENMPEMNDYKEE